MRGLTRIFAIPALAHRPGIRYYKRNILYIFISSPRSVKLVKKILALSVLVIFSLACDRPKPVLEITNHLWPEGTAISVIFNGKVVASSSLYGDHVRINIPRRGAVTVRAAAPAVITALSPELIMAGGVVSYQLPIPVMRRQIGMVNLGVGCIDPKEDSFFSVMLQNSAASISSLFLPPKYDYYVASAIKLAHARAVEVILRADSGNEASVKDALKSVHACADKAERVCADGILFLPGDVCWRSGGFPAEIRTLAALVHNKGMTLAVAITPENLDVFHPMILFDQVPAPECPDELLLLCNGAATSDGNPEVVSLSQIEDALLKIIGEKIPLSRVSIEVRLSARASRAVEKARQPVALAPGELKRVLTETGAGSAIRMGDGSLMLGYKGVDYIYEDLTGIARKMRFLRSGEFSRVHGVHVLYDGLGVRPDAAGLKELAGVFGGK